MSFPIFVSFVRKLRQRRMFTSQALCARPEWTSALCALCITLSSRIGREAILVRSWRSNVWVDMSFQTGNLSARQLHRCSVQRTMSRWGQSSILRRELFLIAIDISVLMSKNHRCSPYSIPPLLSMHMMQKSEPSILELFFQEKKPIIPPPQKKLP